MDYTKLKVALDFDGTISKTNEWVCKLINLMRGTNFTYKDITSWDFWKENNLEKEFWQVWELFDSTDLRSLFKKYDDSLLCGLIDIHYMTHAPLTILTANNPVAKPHILNWIKSQNPIFEEYIPIEVKCIGVDTQLDKTIKVCSAEQKLALDYEIFCDDNPMIAEFIIKYPKKKLLLFNAPWNKHIEESPQIKRVKKWSQVKEKIREFYE